MAVTRATTLVWMMVVAVLVAENGRVCMGLDMDEAKTKMMDGAEKAKEGAEAWADWVKTKFSGDSEGDLKASVKEMTNMAGDKVYEAKEGMKEGAAKMKDKAGASATMAGDKVYEAKEGMKEGAAKMKNNAGGSADVVKEGAASTMHKAGEAANTGYSYAQDKGQDMTKGAKEGMGNAGDAYYEQTSNLGGAYGNAKDSVKGEVKAKYEAAKEKASDMASKVTYHTMPVME